MIPKIIFSFWFNENPVLPEMIRRCIESQKINGYEYKLYTLDNIFKDHPYIQQCLNTPDRTKWCKLSDYLRMHYLIEHGGIYLDADMEVLPNKNFNKFLDCEIFVGKEHGGLINSSVIGSIPNHPFVKAWKEEVETNFRGDDGCVLESGLHILTKNYNQAMINNEHLKLYPMEYFQPYYLKDGTLNYIGDITENTVTYHYFLGSWWCWSELIK